MDSPKMLDLSPSESLLILHPVNASYKALIRFSIVELLHLKILSITRDYAGIKGSPHIKYYYVSRGDNFGRVDLKPHLELFAIPFLEKDKRFPIQHFIRTALKMSSMDIHSFKYTCLYKPLVSGGYFTDTFLRKIYLYLYTSKGRAYKNELTSFIKDAKRNLKQWIEDDHEKLLKLISALGLNILLLDNIDGKLLREINAALGITDKVTEDNSWSFFEPIYFDSSYIDIPESSFDFGGGEFGGGGAGGDWDVGDFDFGGGD